MFGDVLPCDHQSKADQTCKSDCQSDSLDLFRYFAARYGFGDAHYDRAAIEHGNRQQVEEPDADGQQRRQLDQPQGDASAGACPRLTPACFI